MKRIGVFVDISNLYYCVWHKHKGKIDYSKLLDFIKPMGEIIFANAYGAQTEEEAKPFIDILTKLGFTPKYKEPKFYGQTGKADWDVGIAVDMIRSLDEIDIVVLCSADGDMIPVLEYMKERGKSIMVIGAGISKAIQDDFIAIEVPQSLVISR